MLYVKQSHASQAALRTAMVSLVAFGALHATPSMATCATNTGTNTTNCDTSSPNPWTSVVGTGPSTASGATVNLAPGAQISTGNANAISLANNANITLGAGAIVQNNASSGAGLWNAGNNTVEFGSNGIINIAQGAQVLATGTQGNAEAINVMGSGNQIINRGVISATRAAAIWFEDRTVGASNLVDNYGTIRSLAGTNANVIGNSGRGSVTFINRAGARVEGSLSFASGNDNLTLEAGSVITGSFNGGGGTNTLTLSGGAGSSDSLAGNILNFQTLTKTGAGLWTLSGAIGSNGGGTPLSVLVQQGTLALTGNNTNFNGSIQVNAAGTLEARAQSLPPAVANNGLVRFAQPDNGTYAGSINGSGSVEKTQGGVLTLTGVNGYTGGTTIKGGTIAIGADNVIGASNGAITLDGGALSLTNSFNLSAGRAVSVTANNGTIDTAAGVTSTLSQGITGAGMLSKTGAGTLALSGNNAYAGGTTISGGTLQLGAGGTSGSVQGAINNNGTLAFNRSDTVSVGNLISGTGTVNQIGTGTTVLTANNSYTGATNVNAGALYINGDQTAATGLTTVANGATLGGTGIIGGTMTVANGGTLSPGSNTGMPGTLSIQQDLNLSSGSLLDYNFGQAGVVGGPFNDLTKVSGNLTLDGTLNVQTPPGGSFDTGIYRVISYNGTLTDNGLNIGTIPSPNFYVQTSVDKQVNLVNTNGLTLNYWDGAAGPKNDGHINGGDGVWQNFSGNDNWTDNAGTPNAPFSDRAFAIFSAAPGTVTVDNSLGNVNIAGMQVASDGYTIQGDAITLVGSASDPAHSVIRVGDGTSDGAGYTATVHSVLTGNSALVKTDLGTLVLSGNNTYTGGTLINGGTVQVSSDANLGDAAGALSFDQGTLRNTTNLNTNRAITLNAGGGTLATAAGTQLIANGAITGNGALTKSDTGTAILTANNNYTGGTTISGGTLQLGNGGMTGGVVGNVVNNGALSFDRADNVTFNGTISGSGTLNQIGGGTTVLTGANNYTGATNVNAGALYVNGNQAAATGVTSVASGTTLGGTGTLGGAVLIADGATLSPGGLGAPGTLTIQKDLNLGSGSTLNYRFGQANTVGGALNDLVQVGGDLKLAGTLNVQVPAGGSFDAGIYRVINYQGTLTNNGLTIGAIPSPDFYLQTSVDKQVNLINTHGLTLNYWDGAAGPKDNGAINGGDGVWQNFKGNDNWTESTGAINAPFSDRSFAIFTAAPGTVTVDNSLGNVNVAGMQFASNGYTILGDEITLVGTASDPTHSVIRVGDGTSGGASYATTIDAVLTGNSALVKTDQGTLVLGGANTYTGGTAINGGTLQVSSDANLGDAAGALSFDQGTLRNTTNLSTSRAVTLNAGGGTLATAAGTQLTLTSAIAGAGALTKNESGTVILAANNVYTGGTTISGGILQLGGGGASGSIVGEVVDNGTLAFNRSDTATFNGVVSGTGALNQLGSGTTVLNGIHTYSGLTTITNGALAVGDASHATAALNGGGGVQVSASGTLGGYGSVTGAVNNNGTIAVADALPAFAGSAKSGFTINGTLTNTGLAQIGGAGIGNTLKVGNYVGQNGSLALNTHLDGDNAPSDLLVIDGGRASGQSALKITNVGGLGQETPGNGILVVNTINGATSAANAFVLGGRAIAGPYEYSLYRGGRNGATPDAWYLRTEIKDNHDNGINVLPEPEPQPEPEDPRPDYRREVSDYTALSSMMLNFGRATLGTLHERMGEQAQLPTDNDGVNGAWARVIGQSGKWNARPGGIYNQGPSFDNNFVAVQAGGDLFHEEMADGSRNRGGVYGVVGHSNGSVTHYDGSRAGTNKFDAYSLGGYWTHYGARNWYVDGVMQGTWYNAKSGSGQLADLKTNAFGFAASVEAGYPFQLRNQWTVEPQAQLIYQGVSVAQASDSAADVRFGNANSVAGRVGARVARTWALDENTKPRLVTAWLRGNVWHEFTANPMTEISSNTGFIPFRSNLKGSWYELSAGANAQLTNTTSIYANLGYQKGFNKGIQAVSGTLGVRVNW
ncbi:outer membrane autotransporter barrel domain-containing protein [Dyella sp. OK004]|uniref:autotransporter outer membrane beta-barrel domain-containing protein n=1 Tax=Dyella sp. OK004 TaxID=1855292 RepID=UPI0008EF3346|nr:autotransporter outer membrane beta-barrel domain-containing protein [Dyella sp. OK004]SFS15161.1 outer membrane autotransporter barrel domain-containing protein [Dyella sp. OK004]